VPSSAGPAGMVGGQALDMEGEGRTLDEQGLEQIHRRKTGELIRAAIMMPAELGTFTTEQRANLDVFARDIGLVFQIRDDLLEIEQDTATLGKNAGSDATNQKSTYPSALGVEGARKRAAETHKRAVDALETLGEKSAVGLHPQSQLLTPGISRRSGSRSPDRRDSCGRRGT
jgi:geranylgeranyl pyrophosphate synthase